MNLKQQLIPVGATLNQRLSKLVKKHNITITELAQKADVAVGTIQKLMNDPNCNPTIGSLEAICNALDITVSEIIGQDEKLHNLFGKSIFFIEWGEIPLHKEKLQSLIDKNTRSEFVKTSAVVSEAAFALKMEDDSMTPIFPKGGILIFDMEKISYNGAFVLVKLNNCEHVFFKQLLIDEPNKYIKSINPLFKDSLTKLESSEKIIATLVEAKTQY